LSYFRERFDYIVCVVASWTTWHCIRVAKYFVEIQKRIMEKYINDEE